MSALPRLSRILFLVFVTNVLPNLHVTKGQSDDDPQLSATYPQHSMMTDFPPDNCLTAPVDILLLDDISVPAAEYNVQRLDDMVRMFFLDGIVSLNDSRVRLAHLSYADKVYTNFNFSLQGYPLKPGFKTTRNVSDVGRALQFVVEKAFSTDFGSRAEALHVVLMLTHRLPNQDLQDAKRQLIRLNKTNIIVHLAYYNYFQERINSREISSVLPFGNAVLVGERGDDSYYFRFICRPCSKPGWQAVPVGDGIVCVSPVFDIEERHPMDPLHDVCIETTYSSVKVHPLPCIVLETKSKKDFIEEYIFRHFHNRLIGSNNSEGRPIVIELNLLKIENVFKWKRWGNMDNFLGSGHGKRPFYRALTYNNWNVTGHRGNCAVWYFPSVAHDVDGLSTDLKLNIWRKHGGGSTFQESDCRYLRVTHYMCEEIHYFVRGTPGLALDSSLAAESSIHEAHLKGHFEVMENSDNTDFKLESLSNIVASISDGSLEDKGVLPGWRMSREDRFVVDPSDIPRFDCEVEVRPEEIPYSWVLDGYADCSNGHDEDWSLHHSFNGLVDPVFNRIFIPCSESHPCIYCNFNGSMTYIHDEGECENFICPEGFVKCPKSYCIFKSYLRDQEEDCPYGEDEIVDAYQIPASFRIQNKPKCPSAFPRIPGLSDRTPRMDSSKMRDGFFDCPFGEDELLEPTTLRYNFQCRHSNFVLDPVQLCDTVRNCPFGDDELDCDVATCPPGLTCLGGTVRVRNATAIPDDFSDKMLNSKTKYVDLSGVKTSHVEFKRLYFLTLSSNLKNVIHLNLSNCGLEGLQQQTLADYNNIPYSPSEHFRSVRVIDLSRNKLKGLWGHLSIAGSYKYWIWAARTIDFSYNPDFHLDFDDSHFYDSWDYSHFTVRSLDLSYTSVSERDGRILTKLYKLESLYLIGCPISNLKPMLPAALVNLDVRHLEIGLLSPDIFQDMTFMTHIHTWSSKSCCPQVLGKSDLSNNCVSQKDDLVSSCENLIRDSVLRTMVWVVGSLACCGNVLVITYRCIWTRHTFSTGYGLFVLNLSISDFLMGVYLLIIAVQDFRFQGSYVWYDVDWREGPFCKLAGFLSTLASETSAMMIFLITVDRFMVIKFPFGDVRLTCVTSRLLCVFVWITCFTIALLPLLPSFDHWEIYSTSSVCIGLPLANQRFPGWEYSASVFVGLNLGLFICIALGQVSIYKVLSATRKGTSVKLSGPQAQQRFKEDLTIAKQLSMIVVTDFLCWFPIGVLGMMSLAGHVISGDTYSWCAVLVVPVNSALNPVIYTLPAVRQQWEKFKEKYFHIQRRSDHVGRDGSVDTSSGHA